MTLTLTLTLTQGRAYYINTATNETSWERPAAPVVRKLSKPPKDETEEVHTARGPGSPMVTWSPPPAPGYLVIPPPGRSRSGHPKPEPRSRPCP